MTKWEPRLRVARLVARRRSASEVAHSAVAVLAFAGCVAAGSAVAGDYYLRAGIGFDRPAETIFADRDCSSVSPDALYGCGTGGDGAPARSVGKFGTAPALELGLGLAGGRSMRFEVSPSPGWSRLQRAW